MKKKPLTLRKLLLATAALAATVSGFAKSDKPNVLFIMSDDHTWQGVGAYNSRFSDLNPTPTLDRLASEGVVFDNAFTTNSICTPARAAILTGQYPHVNGVLTLAGSIEKERQYLAIEMKNAGYQTAVIGKWHLKERPDAFDYYKVLYSQGDYFDPFFFEKGSTNTITRTYPKARYGKERTFEGAVEMKGHSTDCIGDIALDWFKEKRDPNKPFFLKLHFKAPHDYFEYAPRYEEYLENVHMPEPETLWKRGEGSLATRGIDGSLERVVGTSIGRRNFRRNYAEDQGTPWADKIDHSQNDRDIKAQAYQEYMKAYFRCVKGVDDNVKRVVDYLEAEGLLDNTVIMYTGDQGFFLGEHDMQDKRWAYEPSYRVPYIVRYPKTIKPGRSDAIIENVDFPVTMLDYAGVKRPDYMQGRSARKILDSGKEPKNWRKAAYYQYWMHMAHHDNPAHIAMRTKRYKLIFFYGTSGWDKGYGHARTKMDSPPAWELYDLKNDPTESNNLYDDPEYAPVLKKLKAQFKELRHQVKADDPSVAIDEKDRIRIVNTNAVIDDFWDYDSEDRARAEEIAKAYAKEFGTPTKAER
ncbi:sulfatase family protein [Pelagicoccus mobilis]|uniref:Sulfatase n=1 Tax=Pelagicoccus mobilis TaxID=415221 RepID=A0A934RX21_9BACT|nr:sulfatase [Pelagicoccus mobilis]MBK1877065.1 sulfatase [Pelagicoccus mobilis]